MLSPSLIDKINEYEPLMLGPDYKLPENLKDRAQVAANIIYVGANQAVPQIGDIRVSFEEVKPTDISLVARQKNITFEPYSAKAGGDNRASCRWYQEC